MTIDDEHNDRMECEPYTHTHTYTQQNHSVDPSFHLTLRRHNKDPKEM